MSYNVTLIPGDGIGPEITGSVRQVIEAAGVNINWDIVEAGAAVIPEYGTPLPEYVIESIKKNKVALKGPVTTPVGKGFRSVNVALRKELNLYANLRPAKSLPGINTRYEDIDLVVVRENTEDLYAGVEHMVGQDAAESIKIITREASESIVRFAFAYALKHDRKKVTAVHKANIMKLSDGLFLECARQVASQYPEIDYEEAIVDATSMKLVQDPKTFDVMVMPNLYGDIISDLCAGLIGGLGLAPGANIGTEYAIFESVHGSAPDIAGQDLANPLAIIQSASLMLQHLGEHKAAETIYQAMVRVLQEGKYKTKDLGGSSTTTELTEAIIANMG
ncbi:MAG: isocitrate dehydrogenase (NAD(+)) [Firmicutes bacterium]|nr:isocitrate dehydrogenase (NAD(+)) [Bacillota bacterium]